MALSASEDAGGEHRFVALVLRELRLVVRPSTGFAMLAVTVVVAMLAFSFQRRANTDYNATATMNDVLRVRLTLAAAMNDPVALGGLVAGHAASLVGALAIAAIASLHVAGEWTSGTIHAALLRPRRRWFVMAKFISLWIAAAALFVLAWSLLAVSIPVLTRLSGRPPLPPDVGVAATLAPEDLLKSVLVLAFYAALGTLASIVSRHPLGAFGLTGAFLAGVLIAARVESACPVLPSCWIATIMEFQREEALARHVWIAGRSAFVAITLAWSGLIALTVAALGASVLLLERHDV